MTGTSESDRLRATRLTTRLLLFPDGIARHITLRNAQWDVADRLVRNQGWHKDALTYFAFDQAKRFVKDPESFETELRDSLQIQIRVAMGHSLGYAENLANDDRPGSSPEIQR